MARRWIAALVVAALLGCGPGEGTAEPPSAPFQSPAPVEPAPKAAGAIAPTTPTTPTLHRVDAEGHALAVWAKLADAPRDAIVLVHGRTWSARPDFDLQVPGEQRSSMDALVAEGFAVYAVDLRGYGETKRDATGWLTPSRAAEDLAVVLRWVAEQHADLPPPSVLGWSMGSLVTQLAVQRHPELVSTAILYGYPRSPKATYSDEGSDDPPARKKATAKGAAEDFIVEGAISPAGVAAFVAAALASDPVRTDWRGSGQWNELKPEAVHVPTMVIHGERDPYAPERNQAELFERLGHPDRQWVILPGCDHAAHLEVCGPRFVQAIREFVRRPTARSSASPG